MESTLAAVRWLLQPEAGNTPGHLGPRWIFLRALGLIFFSAFYSLVFQIRGLIGPHGLLPAGNYLEAVAHYLPGLAKYWYAPTLLWLGNGTGALDALCWAGMVASILVVLNIWPRGMIAVCFVCFLTFIGAAQDFSSYQSDGMLLAAGFLSLFFAPPGFRPRWGERQPPSRASLFLLQWLWFRIYFESGFAKVAGGDPEWRHLTAMYEYYQNGPLPTWIGWYVQQFPHWFHWLTALATLILELGLVWMLFLPRRFRILCFFIITPWEIAVILTANYAFLNYLVLALGFLLIDDRFLTRPLPANWFRGYRRVVDGLAGENQKKMETEQQLQLRAASSPAAKASAETQLEKPSGEPAPAPEFPSPVPRLESVGGWRERWRKILSPVRLSLSGIFLGWIFYSTSAQLLWMIIPGFPIPQSPVQALEPFRVANQYGLFGLMTRGRYEIEFQGSLDGATWVAYPFQYKPQDLSQPPGIYAPYQPRFDWNLWFASLGNWRQYPFVLRAEELLLENDRDVLSLFAGNPFTNQPPKLVRAVIWQYWFADRATKRSTGRWWRRQLLGLYAPELEHEPNGRFAVVEMPQALPPHD